MSKRKKDGKSGPFALLAKLGGKFMGILPKLIKTLKVGKIALAGASVAAYSLVFTWQFALVILGMLVIHEYGHLWTMKRFHMKTKGMYLIPFLGAAAVADEDFPSRRTEAVVAIAGPLTGAALAVASGLVFYMTRNPYLAAVASWMALINLFNLLPVSPLDGGRILKSVTMSINSRLGIATMVGGMLLAALLAIRENLVIFVILIPLGVIDFLYERHGIRKEQAKESFLESTLPSYTPRPNPKFKPVMSSEGARNAFLGYVGLAFFLWVFMLVMAHEPGAAGAMKVLQG